MLTFPHAVQRGIRVPLPTPQCRCGYCHLLSTNPGSQALRLAQVHLPLALEPVLPLHQQDLMLSAMAPPCTTFLITVLWLQAEKKNLG